MSEAQPPGACPARTCAMPDNASRLCRAPGWRQPAPNAIHTSKTANAAALPFSTFVLSEETRNLMLQSAWRVS